MGRGKPPRPEPALRWVLPAPGRRADRGRSLRAERCRSLSGPSRKRPKLRPRHCREAPKSPERLPAGREFHLRVAPKLPEIPHALCLRKEPMFPERGGHGRCRAERGGRGEGGEEDACAREGLRKKPRFPERRSPASGSGNSRRLPSAGGPSGSGAARRRPSVRPAGLLEAAAAPCLMLRYFSEENPPASPESRHREGLRCPRGGGPRPPAAGGS